MPFTKLILIGAGGHARSIVDVVESVGEHQIIGFIDSNLSKGDDAFGYPVLGSEDDLPKILSESMSELIIAIGDNFHRHRVSNQVIKNNPTAKFATLVHASAHVSQRAQLGNGTVVMARAVVNAGCQIDEGVIINTAATVDHDGTVSSFASLAPNVTLGGGVVVGERSSIGLGANLIHKVSIADDVCVGAGALVLQTIEQSRVVAYGAPAKIIRQRRADEPYL